jgi:hypothetical protein
MSRIFYMALSSSLLGALFACEPRPSSQTETPLAGNGVPGAALEEARKLEADKYAPSLYGAAVEALEKGDAGDTDVQGEASAESLARRAMDEAIRVREEAKQAADQQIRSARTLLSVVEAVLSHHPTSRDALPSDERMAELRRELSRAESAREAGDFALAGMIAQDISSELSAPRVKT